MWGTFVVAGGDVVLLSAASPLLHALSDLSPEGTRVYSGSNDFTP
jgi:hypothetical protein